ncbi:MAG TPA: type II toxin-antitoxin system RelE/ParE family toxin [Rhodanobacteraceae bacterium]
MSRSFKTRTFQRWLRKSGLTDDALVDAVIEMERGLVDADLGGHLVKKRVALPQRGKRGSTRTIVGTNFQGRWFFLYGFEKSERSNIDQRELGALQGVARDLLALGDEQIEAAIRDGTLLEIIHGNQAQKPHS